MFIPRQIAPTDDPCIFTGVTFIAAIDNIGMPDVCREFFKISDTFKKVAGYRLSGFDFYQVYGLSKVTDQVYFISCIISEKIEIIRLSFIESLFQDF